MQEQADIIVRTPLTGDGEGLARCWVDAAAYYVKLNPELFQMPDTDGLVQGCEDWLLNADGETTYSLVAEKKGNVVGFVSATVHRPNEQAAHQFVRDVGLTRLVIDALVVQEAYWRHGIGRRLMNAAEEWGRARGAVIALLDTYSGSPVSVPFYEQRMGYKCRALHFRKTLT
jgi:GNAT superfamily N-acetyltransferase